MEIGVGLPATVPGTPAELLAAWARLADGGPFSTLGVHDRLAWEGHDCLTVLAGAAAVTRRIGLASVVLIAPLRDTEQLAHRAEVIHAQSGGRLTLGVGLGPRRDDYERAEVPYRGRGRRLDSMLLALRPRWVAGGPRLLVGGGGDAALARMASYSDGYVHGGGPARAFKGAADRALAAWLDAGRPGRPRLVGTAYFALGDRVDAGRDYLRRYYAFTGPFAERIAGGLLSCREEIAELVAGYAEAGCDELVIFPTVADLDQLDLLEAALT